MSMTLPVKAIERELEDLLRRLSLGETITLLSAEGEPIALLVSLKSIPVESERVEDWETRWDNLAQRASAAWKDDKSAVETLTEMRR